MLRIQNLTKVYATGTVALQDVSFEVKDGEFLVVIGLSGSGKSTLLRCINRLIDPTEGKIYWDDTDITAATSAELLHIRRNIGMVFQQFNLVKRSSVITNVLSGRLGYANPWLSLIGIWPDEDKKRALKALNRVEIADKAYNRADTLSGGQQQRVGIARALMQAPKLILADEPVASLDPVLSHSILQYLEQLNKEGKVEEAKKSNQEVRVEMQKLMTLVAQRQSAQEAQAKMNEARIQVQRNGLDNRNLLFRLSNYEERSADEAFAKNDFAGAAVLYRILAQSYRLGAQCSNDESCVQGLRELTGQIKPEFVQTKRRAADPWLYEYADQIEKQAEAYFTKKEFENAAASYIQAAFLYEKMKEK